MRGLKPWRRVERWQEELNERVSAALVAFEIGRVAVAALDGPALAAREHCVNLRSVEPERAGAADARGDLAKQRVGDLSFIGSMSPSRKPLCRLRTPHETWKSTPPAEITPPASASNAATPPIGKPWPQCASGIA